jgi:hypothetical protein
VYESHILGPVKTFRDLPGCALGFFDGLLSNTPWRYYRDISFRLVIQTLELEYALKVFETFEDLKPIINIGQFADKFNLKSRVGLVLN